LEQTFAAVEMRAERIVAADRGKVYTWERVRDDSDWSLIFHWHRTSELLGTSVVEIVWEIEEWAEPGVYRLRYYGDAKALTGRITEFEGVRAEFRVF
jgi:neutral ceramidase